MNLEIGRFTPSTGPLTQAPPPTRGERYAGAPTAHGLDAPKGKVDGYVGFDTVTDEIGPVPTEAVRDQVGIAAQRVDELAAQNRELHFSQDKHSGRVVIEVRDLEGKVVRTIPPSHALDVMSGAAL
jgi:hypothetical protein